MPIWSVFAWVVALGVPVLLVFSAAMAVFHGLWWRQPLLAPLFGVLGTAAAAWVSFLAYWAHPVFGLVVTSSLIVAAVVVFARSRLWVHWRAAVPLLALLMGSLIFSIGFTYVWGAGPDPYTVVANRFFYFSLPVDNTIPRLFQEHLMHSQSTHPLIGDWNGGDRPPLQVGFELLFSPFLAAGQSIAGAVGGGSFTVAGLGGALPTGATFALDVFAQYLWIPAGYGFLRLLGFARRASVGALVLAAVVPSTVVNTLFTWPKMLSAALVLTAFGFLFATRRAQTGANWTFVFAVVAAVFGVLAHGAAAFALPALVVVGLYALRGIGRRSAFAPIAVGASIGLALYLPWIAYQRFVDPPGDRLLKWHLAGVTTPTDTSFLHVLASQYFRQPISEALDARVQNLVTFLGLDQGHLVFPFNQLTTIGFRTEDWTSTLFALGAVALGSLVAMLVWSAVRFRSLTVLDKERLLLIGAMMLSVVVWGLLLFSPNATIVAQGSHSWMLVFTLVPFAWLLQRLPRIGWGLIVLQAVLFVSVYYDWLLGTRTAESPSIPAIVVFVLGLLFLLTAPLLLASDPSTRSRRRAELEVRPRVG
ncbi:hypothetical protein [Herbiconiux ginsengi]|uniref:Glycosyltransferase RgtA/B/C/D-like domain-containing protein n=1 Tax=Herbiconiux ginsengi TaxID=381665 RepID=A0A1H3K8H3_9MICO|nr:hypothetical protein [Herbiconiux ginsengi]SDY48199.1 hypothetical protein SAMN05216554_0456 [Herbiconiux ginsengi]